jgi:hypothetical protein
MLLADKQFLETPFHSVRQMTWHLQDEGHTSTTFGHSFEPVAFMPSTFRACGGR